MHSSPFTMTVAAVALSASAHAYLNPNTYDRFHPGIGYQDIYTRDAELQATYHELATRAAEAFDWDVEDEYLSARDAELFYDDDYFEDEYISTRDTEPYANPYAYPEAVAFYPRDLDESETDILLSALLSARSSAAKTPPKPAASSTQGAVKAASALKKNLSAGAKDLGKIKNMVNDVSKSKSSKKSGQGLGAPVKGNSNKDAFGMNVNPQYSGKTQHSSANIDSPSIGGG